MIPIPYWYQTTQGKIIKWLLIFGLIVSILTIAILITRKMVIASAEKKSRRMELELKAIYAQINPHFIFNSLNSALLLVSKDKTDEAYNHISKFSRLLRSYLKSSRNKLVSLSEEMVNLKDYIELQQTRFKEKFEFEIITELIADPETIKIPSLLLQPFVENSINHGILPMETEGKLTIKLFQPNGKNEIICTITDNGIGRKNSKERAMASGKKMDSYGDLLIKDLVDIFNSYEQMNIEIAYSDRDGLETGTMVTISIKNLHYEQ